MTFFFLNKPLVLWVIPEKGTERNAMGLPGLGLRMSILASPYGS